MSNPVEYEIIEILPQVIEISDDTSAAYREHST